MESPKYGRPKRVPNRVYTLMIDAWGLAIGLAAIISSVLAIVLPEEVQQDRASAILGEVLQDLFTLSYGVSGSFIVYGLLSRNYPADALGLVLLATTLTVQVVTYVSVIGWTAVYAVPSTLALVIAALVRAAVVSRLVEPEDKGGVR